jgi:uncharacterized membrane protein
MKTGDRIVLKMAAMLSSPKFSVALAGVLATNFLWNALAPVGLRYDPQPYFYANLAMSAMATFTAPILLMVANKQAELDRQNAAITQHDSAEDLALDTKALALLKQIAQKMEIEA